MTKQRAMGMALVLAMGVMSVAPAWAQSEGLKVRGRWTIDVRQPDGTLVAHHEFDNALVTASSPGSVPGMTTGEMLLVSMLGGVMSVGQTPWSVALGNWLGGGTGLMISEGPSPFPASPNLLFSTNLTTQVKSNPVLFELSGSYTTAIDLSIATVSTVLFPCSGARSGGFVCSVALQNVVEVTRHGLAAPIVVQAGQIVQVVVRISFS